MKQKRFNVEQIVAVLKQAEAEVPLAELTWRVGIPEQTIYRWKKHYVGLEVDQVRQLKQLQEEKHPVETIGRRSDSRQGDVTGWDVLLKKS